MLRIHDVMLDATTAMVPMIRAIETASSAPRARGGVMRIRP
jgi:hypothetical protein